jgi:hypothetical protein
MRVSSRAGAVQEDGGGHCACFLEAEPAALGESESGLEGAAEELGSTAAGRSCPEQSAFDAARDHRSHGCGDEALDLVWVAFVTAASRSHRPWAP